MLIDEHSLNTFPTSNVLPVHIELVNKIDASEVLTSHYDVPQLEVHSTDIEPSDNKTIFDSIVIAGLGDNATVNHMWAAAMVHMKTKGGGFLQIPHGDRPVNEFYNAELLPLTYPTLFPYGLGGFEDL